MAGLTKARWTLVVASRASKLAQALLERGPMDNDYGSRHAIRVDEITADLQANWATAQESVDEARQGLNDLRP